MNLHSKLRERAAQGRPLRVGLIGAGKFGTMYLAQAPKTPGIQLAGIADIAPAAALANLVVGRLMPAAESLEAGALTLGLANGWKVTHSVAAGELVRWNNVTVDSSNSAVQARREMERLFTVQEACP